MAYGIILYLRREGAFPDAFDERSAAAFYLLLAVATTILWIPTFRMNMVLNVTLFTVIIVFVMDAAAAASGNRACEVVAGALSCVAATFAFYLSLLDVVNEAWGTDVLPLYPHVDHAGDFTKRWYVPRPRHHKSAVSTIHST
jgi:succinate-acetate transporter protein